MQGTCLALFSELAKSLNGLKPAYYVRELDGWKSTSWRAYYLWVEQFAAGLIELGHETGDKVGILGFNRPEWVGGCLGAQLAAGVSAGVYSSCSPEEIEYILNHAEAKFLIVENSKRYREQILPILGKLNSLKKIILMQDDGTIQDPNVISFANVIELGAKADGQKAAERRSSIDPKGVSTLIYTSGTTGPPKAVMLSHQSIVWTVKTATDVLNVGESDCILSYLPLAHVAEQMFSVYAPISSGASLYFAESMEKLADNMKEVQPTIFFGVPRVYEKFYEKVSQKVKEAKGTKQFLLNWAQSVATRVWEKKHASKAVPPMLNLQYQMAQKLIFGKLKPLLGMARARVCISGAAPISRQIIEFFLSLDVPIYEVYGQSEDCGPTTINLPGVARLGSVGRPLPGVEVKVAQDGEILVKGPNVFLGYLKDENATNEILQDGWLCSGDIGEFDKDGFLKITDRKKDLLITAGGKNIAPQNLESMLKMIPFVSSAVVVGDQRKYLAALLTPKEDALLDFAKANNLTALEPQKIVSHQSLLEQIQQEINALNRRVASVEQIKKFALLPHDFSVETGELTPTMKVKRKVVNTKYKNEIEALYQ